MSVQRPTIQRAFAIAHRAATAEEASCSDRETYGEIARLIWKACGEVKEFPAPNDVRIAELLKATGE
jgi:hypothetical protein